MSLQKAARIRIAGTTSLRQNRGNNTAPGELAKGRPSPPHAWHAPYGL